MLKKFLWGTLGALWCFLCAYFGVWWLLVPSAVLYQYYVQYPVLIVCGFILDVHFGQPVTGLYLTYSAFVLYAGMMVVRPWLRYSE